MGDAPASNLDRLVALPGDVQILVLGEGRGMSEWVEDAGDAAAMVDVAQVAI